MFFFRKEWYSRVALQGDSPSKNLARFLRHRRLEASGFLSFKIFKGRLEASRVGLPPRGTPRRRAPRLHAAYKTKPRALLAVGADTASRGERWVLLRRAKA